ncbi:Vacuolar calcium ion transporter [Gracilariopsis chorda]|uniref:Vacuolar calcium ion transporter n=1 Tax=Gracilariopsis chorda TaxID=448386 RepID=A0A2V3IK69_9FLOR|nr:Vacuolar calcium ion transporter [Gracilariopsis chorda]|eukprot:PXF42467.1 Vacuolar calcium ion transporter [Gracilariopsis chorda]
MAENINVKPSTPCLPLPSCGSSSSTLSPVSISESSLMMEHSPHPTQKLMKAQTVGYGATTSSRKNELEAVQGHGAQLTIRHSSDAVMVGRRFSNYSEINASAYGQLNQLRDGINRGLDGYSSNLNALLVFVPLGILAGLFGLPDFYVFVFNFLGMVPLAMLLGKATEDIAEHTNETLGALVNVTFGNAVELILSISALRAGRMTLIQDTIAGSVLSNLLLVLGSAFFFGGLRYREQMVLPAVSEANADLLSFAVFGFSIPALFAMALPNDEKKGATEEKMSLVTSVCLLLMYAMYLTFQLYTHAELYQGIDQEVDEEAGVGEVSSRDETVASLPMAFGILVGMVVLVALCSEFLVSAIDGFSERVGLGQKFIAVVLLPVVGNAVEHMSAILVARHNKIDLSIGIACGSSVQIALFAAPLLVVISWLFGSEHLTLNFALFETVCIGFSVFVVNATLRDSRSNWLEGAVLVMCYVILAAAFYFME